ncbi:MAG: hypothetical protein FWD73_10950 [Polyangiaceae bacterium]|nr:hypothetical protein [Polyangiaceae bacterium]
MIKLSFRFDAQPGRSRRLLRALIFAGIVAAATTPALNARADSSHATVDWGRLLIQLDNYVRGGRERPNAQQGQSTPLQNDRTFQPFIQTAGNAWFGVAPRVSFVARDWGTAFRIAGDRISLVDAMRLTASTRMVLTRVRLSNARVTPFLQIGAGQWRTDSNILPRTPHSTEIAAQVGGGVEMQLMASWQIACEIGGTLFIRDERDADDLPATKLWSAMIASRIVF